MAPHESVIYTWEEPMKAHKLDLRVGLKRRATGEESSRRGLLHRRVPYEFSANQSALKLRLDEIGLTEMINVQEVHADDGPYLVAKVEAEGMTRVLTVEGMVNARRLGGGDLMSERLDDEKMRALKESLGATVETLSKHLSLYEHYADSLRQAEMDTLDSHSQVCGSRESVK